MNADASKVYNVYLNGEMIGAISSKEKLYDLIDKKQNAIKEKYNVTNVYPPSSLQVLENWTYEVELTDLNTIYEKIESANEFNIYGYEVKFSSTQDHNEYSIYVLDKQVFYDAIKKFVLAFISEEDYEAYMNGSQDELEGLGILYQDMKILEEVSIREKYISTNEKIYENSEELAQELLFGFDYKEQSYVIKSGDTIESISESNSLNPQEFLIANPNYSSPDSLLVIGDKVNITLINPQLAFAYTVSEAKKVEYDYDTVVVRDKSKPASYSEITTPGVKGISIIHSHYDVVNGEQNSEEVIDSREVVREKVDQVTTKGRKEAVWGWQRYEDTGSGWRWPTENPYAVTSEFAWRWGRQHNGIDISGSGWGSKIYAANDGVVVKVVKNCPDNGSYPNSCGGGYGNSVYINHGDNIYTVYAHLTSNVTVKEGQQLSRGTVVGYMGNSGQSRGTHLHFGLSIGYPGQGSYQNPRGLFK
jgi:murein DD-endopeptidase MepM/ murein hydrolase activator NlpD